MRAPMPLFVDPQDVILRMQLDASLTGIEDVIRSGIIAAQLHVERIIDGRIARQSQNALYHLDAESFSGITPGGAYRLEIPSGLIRQDVPQTVSASSSSVAGPFTSYEAVQSDLLKFDYDRGYLHLDATYGNYHVRVGCETGYEPGTRPTPVEGVPVWDGATAYAVGALVAFQGVSYTCVLEAPAGMPPSNAAFWTPAYVPQEPIPDAMYEAIISLVPMVFNAQQTTNRSDEAQKQYVTLTDHANLLLQPWVRTKGFSFRTMFGNTG